MKKTLAVVLALGVFGIGGMISGTDCKADLIKNGGFGIGGYFNGWSFTGEVDNQTYTYRLSGAGTYEVDLASFSPGTPATGQISQAFETTPGTLYNLSFLYGKFNGNDVYAPRSIRVLAVSYDNSPGDLLTLPSVLDKTITDYTNGVMFPPMYFSLFDTYSFEFEATGYHTLLGFLDVDSSAGSGYAVLDNVRVNAVPVPATMLLFGPGMAGLIGARIRRKNR